MFYSISQTSRWNPYPSSLTRITNIESNQTANLESNSLAYVKHKQDQTTSRRVSTMKTITEPSQISPAGSLDSVGSLPLSSVENSNSDPIDDIETTNLR